MVFPTKNKIYIFVPPYTSNIVYVYLILRENRNEVGRVAEKKKESAIMSFVLDHLNMKAGNKSGWKDRLWETFIVIH